MPGREMRVRKTLPFTLPRKVVAHMTSRAWQTVPHVAYLYEPDITHFYEHYQALAHEKEAQGHKISFNTLLLRVIVEGLKAAPELNALIDYHPQTGSGQVQVCEAINLSVPWLLPDGSLITPVVFGAEALSLDGLSAAIAEIGEKIRGTDVQALLYQAVRADTLQELKRFNLAVIPRIIANLRQPRRRSGTEAGGEPAAPNRKGLTANDLLGGTVTVSNIGSLYREQKGHFGLLEIIPPQIFVVGLGAAQERPGVYVGEAGQKQIGIRTILPMCLAFDHRAVDFRALTPFLKRLDEIFADPEMIRLW